MDLISSLSTLRAILSEKSWINRCFLESIFYMYTIDFITIFQSIKYYFK
jgi:hypothetical protein